MTEMTEQLDVAVLGAGAAGMMGAIAAAERLGAGGRVGKVGIFEKNVRPGIKVLVCGGGRCNFTNAGSVEFLIEQFGRNGRFLTPALRHLDNEGLRDFFAGLGVPSHVEQGASGGKVYPDSNQAKSVVDALVRRMEEAGVRAFAGAEHAIARVERAGEIENRELRIEKEGFVVTTVGGARFLARMVLLAVGGMSYQRMGTVGDGYRMAAGLGHTIVTPRPAIVGLLCGDAWVKELQGLAVRDVEVTIETQNAKLKTQRSVHDLLFTHFGLSGPAILNPSEVVAELLETAAEVTLRVDFCRHVTHEGAHAILRSWQQGHGKKRLRTMLADPRPEITISATSPDQTGIGNAEFRVQNSELQGRKGKTETEGANLLALPARLAVKVCQLEGIDPELACATLTSAQMHRLVERIKRCGFGITGTRGFKEAMVTAGGVSLKEVDPRTMESKRVPGLFLSGEVLDLTGPSGGYNLQLAFSTGHLAGTVMGERLRNAAS